MDLTNQIILIASLAFLVSILASLVGQRLGMPVLLVFLIIGMLLGEEGPGDIHFDDVQVTHLVGSLALAIILYAMTLDHTLRMLVTLTSKYYRLIDLPEASFGLLGSLVAVIGLIVPKVARTMAGITVTPQQAAATGRDGAVQDLQQALARPRENAQLLQFIVGHELGQGFVAYIAGGIHMLVKGHQQGRQGDGHHRQGHHDLYQGESSRRAIRQGIPRGCPPVLHPGAAR